MSGPATSWRVVAWFDTQEQAKQAAAMLVSMAPRCYHFAAHDGRGAQVWVEEGNDYGAHSVRV